MSSPNRAAYNVVFLSASYKIIRFPYIHAKRCTKEYTKDIQKKKRGNRNISIFTIHTLPLLHAQLQDYIRRGPHNHITRCRRDEGEK